MTDRIFCTYLCECGHQWFMIHDVNVWTDSYEINCPDCDEPNEPADMEDQGEDTRGAVDWV